MIDHHKWVSSVNYVTLTVVSYIDLCDMEFFVAQTPGQEILIQK